MKKKAKSRTKVGKIAKSRISRTNPKKKNKSRTKP